MRIHIFTVSTGVYNQYIDYQAKSLDNIYPGVEKTWNLISDKEYHLNLNEHKDYTESNYYHISDLPYPFITYFKTQYVRDMIKKHNFNNDDMLLFCDVDSYFIDKGADYYKNIFNDDKLHFATSPWMDFPHSDIVVNETKHNRFSKSYFGKYTKQSFPQYVQSSIFFGRIDKFIEMNNVIMRIIGEDAGGFSEIGIIPTLADQSLMNKYIHDNPDKIISEYYISDSYEWDVVSDDYFVGNPSYNKHQDTIFCIQKFKGELKSKKRYNPYYDI